MRGHGATRIVIVGAKNPHTGRIIAAIVQAGELPGSKAVSPFVFHGFVDNDPDKRGTSFCGLPVFGGFDELDGLVAEGCVFVNTITGSTEARYETSLAIRARGGSFVNLIHPTADGADEIGTGNYIQEHVVMQAGVRIADNASIHAGALISHESTIGSSAFIAPRVSVSGEVAIGDGVFVGTGAIILPRVVVGNWATIAAGAVVLKDVPPRAVVMGNPAKVLWVNEPRYQDGAIA